MKRILSLMCALFLAATLYSGVAPVSSSIGKLAVEIKADSMEAFVQKAFTSEFTDEWLSTYASNGESFAITYGERLASVLPMENIVLSGFDGNEIKVMSLASGKVVSIIIKEGRISALSFSN